MNLVIYFFIIVKAYIFEIGGPSVYSLRELYEVMYNIMGREPKLAYFPHEMAVAVAKVIPNWQYFNLDTILKNT